MAGSATAERDSTLKLDGIAAQMRSPVSDYLGFVRGIMSERIRGLTFFGVVVGDSFDESYQTARNVLVVDPIDLDQLRRISERGAALGKAAIAAPLVMTPAYIAASLDTFPLELMVIHLRHATVFGDEHFADLAFDDAHVRLQCERELKVAAISLRQGLLATAGQESALANVEMEIGDGLMRTLCGLLWLKGKRDAAPAGQVIAEVERLVKRPLPGLRAAVDVGAYHGWSEFKSLYEDVIALQEMADAL
jgi:hypothetical protein